jgi:hypothetical protein
MEAGLNHAYVIQRGLPVGVFFTPSPRSLHRTLYAVASAPQRRCLAFAACIMLYFCVFDMPDDGSQINIS